LVAARAAQRRHLSCRIESYQRLSDQIQGPPYLAVPQTPLDAVDGVSKTCTLLNVLSRYLGPALGCLENMLNAQGQMKPIQHMVRRPETITSASIRQGRCSRSFPLMIRSPTFSPAVPAKTLLRSSMPLATNLANQGRDHSRKLSRSLIDRFSHIAMEDLNVKGLAGGMLANSVHNAARNQLTQQIR
jgi:hypothetical protein